MPLPVFAAFRHAIFTLIFFAAMPIRLIFDYAMLRCQMHFLFIIFALRRCRRLLLMLSPAFLSMMPSPAIFAFRAPYDIFGCHAAAADATAAAVTLMRHYAITLWLPLIRHAATLLMRMPFHVDADAAAFRCCFCYAMSSHVARFSRSDGCHDMPIDIFATTPRLYAMC